MQNTADLFIQLRPGWIDRVSRNLAKGTGVRESFLIQLNQFYDSLQQSVESGDPAWMETILADWAAARTATELADAEISLYPLISNILNLTNEYIRDSLSPADGMTLTAEILPVFAHMYENVAEKEIKMRISHVFQELESARTSLEKLDKASSSVK